MNTKYTLLACFLFIFYAGAFAQSVQNYAVMVQANVTDSPAAITLKWKSDSAETGYDIYRDDRSAPLVSMPAGSVTYTDVNVQTGKRYEYYVRRKYADVNRYADGYIYAGIKAVFEYNPGRLLLLIDDTYANPLNNELIQLEKDLINEGWYVMKDYIGRNKDAAYVKQTVKQFITSDKINAVYLLGNIAVPYSGDIFPDGHRPDHRGAWPADVYYGVFDDGFWTDTDVQSDTAFSPRNRNVPGDGKFDPDYIYGHENTLMIGRVYLDSMPAFGSSDVELARQYLNKVHAFKTAAYKPVRRGVIDDNFGVMNGEAFAANAYRYFTTMFGDSVSERDYMPSVHNESSMFAYACGGGSYTSILGVGVTADYVTDSVQVPFHLLFGSYLGDWHSKDNFLRAPLCAKYSGLASAWSGRPHWHIHHMALGKPIGYSARLTQNNIDGRRLGANNHTGYIDNAFPTYVHTALMGDPTLRLHYIKPVEQITVQNTNEGRGGVIKWTPSPDATEGYVVLRGIENAGFADSFIVIAQVNDTSFTDTAWLDPGAYYYQVRPLKLETTASGSYYNPGLGAYAGFSIATGVEEKLLKLQVKIYPNPAHDLLQVEWTKPTPGIISIMDLTGKNIFTKAISQSDRTIHTSEIPQGLYIVKISSGNQQSTQKLMIIHQ